MAHFNRIPTSTRRHLGLTLQKPDSLIEIISLLLGFQTQKKITNRLLQYLLHLTLIKKNIPVVDEKKYISRTLLAYRNKTANSFLETYFNFKVIQRKILCIEDKKYISSYPRIYNTRRKSLQMNKMLSLLMSICSACMP